MRLWRIHLFILYAIALIQLRALGWYVPSDTVQWVLPGVERLYKLDFGYYAEHGPAPDPDFPRGVRGVYPWGVWALHLPTGWLGPAFAPALCVVATTLAGLTLWHTVGGEAPHAFAAAAVTLVSFPALTDAMWGHWEGALLVCALLAIHRYETAGDWRTGIWLGLAMALKTTALFVAIPLGVHALLTARSRRDVVAAAQWIGVSVAVFALGMLPFAAWDPHALVETFVGIPNALVPDRWSGMLLFSAVGVPEPFVRAYANVGLLAAAGAVSVPLALRRPDRAAAWGMCAACAALFVAFSKLVEPWYAVLPVGLMLAWGVRARTPVAFELGLVYALGIGLPMLAFVANPMYAVTALDAGAAVLTSMRILAVLSAAAVVVVVAYEWSAAARRETADAPGDSAADLSGITVPVRPDSLTS